MDDKETRITVRFSSALIERLRHVARTNTRSLNGEIVRAVTEYVERQQSEGKAMIRTTSSAVRSRMRLTRSTTKAGVFTPGRWFATTVSIARASIGCPCTRARRLRIGLVVQPF
jgi:hypothetical protein